MGDPGAEIARLTALLEKKDADLRVAAQLGKGLLNREEELKRELEVQREEMVCFAVHPSCLPTSPLETLALRRDDARLFGQGSSLRRNSALFTQLSVLQAANIDLESEYESSRGDGAGATGSQQSEALDAQRRAEQLGHEVRRGEKGREGERTRS